MADETREDGTGLMNQGETPEEKSPQELSSADDIAADELFDSFMEIANDPKLQEEEANAISGVGDGVREPSDPPDQKLQDSSSDAEKQDEMEGTNNPGEANASSDPSILEQNDSNSITDKLQTDAQTGKNDQNKTESDLKDSLKRTLEQEEAVESSDLSSPVKESNNSENEQSCPQGKDGVEGGSASYISDSGEVNSHGAPEHGAPEHGAPEQGATEVPSEKMAISNQICDEEKSVDQNGTTVVVPSNPDATSKSVRTEESLEKSLIDTVVQTTESSETDSVDSANVSSGDVQEVDSSTTTDLAKSLSKAMEDLAGLEQQLCTAMTQMKQSNEKKIEEESGKEGCIEAITSENVDNGNKDEESCKKIADEVDNDNSETEVDITETPVVEKENAVSDEQVLPCSEDSQVEDSSVLETSNPADGHEDVGQEGELSGEVSNAEEPSQEVTGQECKNDLDNASTEKSDSADELDLEVARSGMEAAIPDIEITTDESGISAGTEESSSNSRPGTPASNEDGIDSDTPSDYGDDEENNAFGTDNLGASNRKSWLLETDRERLSSDSSTVSERDFRDSFSKSDIPDGKSMKEG